MIKLPNGSYAVAASYTDQPIVEYQNPLIEALPPLMSKHEVAEKIGNYPHISDDERGLDAHYRMHLVQRIFQYFQPLPFHISLEQSFSRIIRQSFIARNPLKPEYAMSFHEGWKDIEREIGDRYVQNATAFSTSIVGISGMGKTTSIDRILRLIPQVIVHYFTTLVNELSIPVVFISTPSGMSVLQSQFRQARRSSGQGDLLLDRLKKDAIWDLFILGLWKYQWTRNVVPLDDELSATLYEVSQGIIDIACKVFAMSQLRAISTGKEIITSSLIRVVAVEQFRLLKPMLDALKEGKSAKLASFEDIIIPDFATFSNKEQNKVDLSMLLKKEVSSRNQQLSKLKENALLRLRFLGIEGKDAERNVEKAMLDRPDLADVNAIVQTVYQLTFTDAGKSERSEIVQGDLRKIVQSGRDGGLHAYEALKRAGYIKA